jgi:hypothetical protein
MEGRVVVLCFVLELCDTRSMGTDEIIDQISHMSFTSISFPDLDVGEGGVGARKGRHFGLGMSLGCVWSCDL